jgi:hypothetical protein
MSPVFARVRRAATIGAAIGLLLTAAGFAVAPASAFFQAALFSFVFVVAFPLGSLGLLSIHQLTSGGWGTAAEPFLRAAMRTLPFMIVPFGIVALGMDELYPWMDHARVEHDPLLLHKAAYLNQTAFLARSAVYFGILIGCATLLERARSRGEAWRYAGPGILLYALSVSFGVIDWAMSIEPLWYSTVYPLILIAGQGLASLCLVVVFAALSFGTIADVTIGRFHDLAKLIFAFLMLWAYVSFSQLIIIWSGNLAEEAPWYLHRLEGGWSKVALFTFLFGFALPWLALLSKHAKRHVVFAGSMAAWLIVVRLVDVAWLILPAYRHGLHLEVFDAGVPILFVSGFLILFTRNLGSAK